jgi:trk system potassium uptake protein TrkA
MNIVILGAGTVGASIAETLCDQQHNVTLVDASRATLDGVGERLDVQTICGSACDAIMLFQAGVQSSDLTLCVTNSDEVNFVSASLAKVMGARRTVARIFNPAYRDVSTFDYRRHFGIDRLLSLEHLTALELAKAIRRRELFAVENFARGDIEVQELAAAQDCRAVGVPLKELEIPRGVRIGLISSETRTIIPGGDDVVMADDRVTLVGTREEIEKVTKLFEYKPPPSQNVIIAGGGEIGFHLASSLESGRFNVLLLEADEERCSFLAGKLDKTTILHADTTRLAELEEARVGKTDVFVAATGRDEDNIVCGVEARELGAKRVMSVVRRADYANVLKRLGIDVAVSPREVMYRQILGLVELGPILGRSTIAGGGAEVWEIEVPSEAPITMAPLRDVDLPQSLIVAIEREDYVRVPGADDQLRPGDSVVVLVQQSSTEETLRLFQPA